MAGMILRWFRDEFGDGMDYSALIGMGATVSPGSDGLILLPHFSGMHCPLVNPEAKGVFYGITMAHGKPHFVRAILEAVAFALRSNIELLRESGIDCQDITSLGGAARSPVWLQIKADVLQRQVYTMQCEETTSLGTAVLAAAGTGIFTNIEEAVRAMVHRAKAVSPTEKNKRIYDSVFQTYEGLNLTVFRY